MPAPITIVRPPGWGFGKNCGRHFAALTAEIALEYENGAARAELSTELDGKAVFAYELVKN